MRIRRLTLATSINRRIVDVRARHHSLIRANTKRNARKRSAASISITTLSAIVASARNTRIVRGDDTLRKIEQRGSGVHDSSNSRSAERATANRISVTSKPPETPAAINRDISDGTGMLRVINEAEIIGANSALLKIGSEERRGEGSLGIGEESLLLDRLDRIDGVEGEAEQAVVVLVLLELG